MARGDYGYFPRHAGRTDEPPAQAELERGTLGSKIYVGYACRETRVIISFRRLLSATLSSERQGSGGFWFPVVPAHGRDRPGFCRLHICPDETDPRERCPPGRFLS